MALDSTVFAIRQEQTAKDKSGSYPRNAIINAHASAPADILQIATLEERPQLLNWWISPVWLELELMWRKNRQQTLSGYHPWLK
jgi:hypothetical protein